MEGFTCVTTHHEFIVPAYQQGAVSIVGGEMGGGVGRQVIAWGLFGWKLPTSLVNLQMFLTGQQDASPVEALPSISRLYQFSTLLCILDYSETF